MKAIGILGCAVAAWFLIVSGADAQILVSANDGKVRLNNGVTENVKDGIDTVTFVDIAQTPPRVIAEIEVPNSVIGPPSNVAVSPDGSLVLVTSARTYSGTPAKQVSDERVTVIALRPRQTELTVAVRPAFLAPDRVRVMAPKVAKTLHVGKGPAGIAINREGTLALVANRDEGSISVLKLADGEVTEISRVAVGDAKSGPSAVAFTPDGTKALVTLYGPGAIPTGTQVVVLRIQGDAVEVTDRRITTGLGPFGIDVSAAGDIAVVANLGGGVTGDADVISVLDLNQSPIRVVNSASVAPSPEGIKLSPDGRYLAVSSVDGTHKPQGSVFFKDAGTLQIFRVNGTALEKIVQAPAGHWCQGVAWSSDASRVYLQCMVEQEIQVFSFEPDAVSKLRQISGLKLTNGPAGLAIMGNAD